MHNSERNRWESRNFRGLVLVVEYVSKCPFDAIVIVNLAKELGTDKIHQFGINSFRLYRLPMLKKGYVVGLLGKNGIGKSTIVNILSGNLRPNFGNYDRGITSEDIIDKFQGAGIEIPFRKDIEWDHPCIYQTTNCVNDPQGL